MKQPEYTVNLIFYDNCFLFNNPFTNMPGQKTILLASAQVYSEYLDHLRCEQDAIESALTNVKHEIERVSECTLNALFDKFNKPESKSKNNVRVLHYSGHSSQQGLTLHNSGPGNQIVSVAQFSEFLSLQSGLEVVFLNSCCSESIGEELLGSGIKAVIETTSVVRDSEAAKFSELIYKGLNAGKSLEVAFKQAVSKFENEDYKCNPEGGNHRYINGLHVVDKEEKCAWKLAYNDKSFVENWFLIERQYQKFFHADVTTRVLAVYEPNDANEQYFRTLQNVFRGHSEILIYPLHELQEIKNPESYIADSQIALFFLTEGFSNYWTQVEVNIKPALKCLHSIFLGCDGDILCAVQTVKDELSKEKASIFPPPPFTLKQLAEKQNLEVAFNSFCAEGIRQEISNPAIKSSDILTDEFDNLNFGKQRQPFESSDEKAFQFGSYNLVLVEGSPFCAQELLIKKLMLYATPRIDRNIKPKILSIGKNIPNTLTTSELYQHLTHTLLGVKVNLGMEALKATISQKLEEQDLVIVLNDVFEENEDCLAIFRDFWNELVMGIESPPKHRLFLFIVHKACKESKNHWNASGFVANAPISNVRLLDAIEPLNIKALNTWHGSTGKRFPNGHFFDSLINEPYSSQILKDPFMTKAIHEICALMKCPDVPDRVLTI